MSDRHAHVKPHPPRGGEDAGHGHADHSHAPASFGQAFLIGTILNVGFVAIEAGYGIASSSMALLADAGHNLSDVLGLIIAWGASTLSKRLPSARYSYGLRRTSTLAALFNAIFLLVAIGAIAFEAVRRLNNPQKASRLLRSSRHCLTFRASREFMTFISGQ